MAIKHGARKKLSRKDQLSLDTRISFMEGLVRRAPDYIEALQLLGDHYTARGSFDDGLKVDEHLCTLEPTNPVVFYNLACSYSLTSQIDRAVFALDRALTLGYADFKWLAQDPDLDNLRRDPIYRDIETKIRQMKIKVR
ncbi:MAG TPA: hypothetical protein VH255_04560 [Verrucomicrobiae bacterium]|nr:hypothetical protein [Verrucomicrobiae bacterium]